MNPLHENNENLPDFLQNAPRHEEAGMTAGIKTHSPLRRIFFSITGIWLALILGYIQFYFGWSSLSALLPGEFAMFLAEIFIPLAAVLLLAVFIHKAALTAKQAAAVEQSLQFALRSGGEETIAKIISQSLQKQIAEMAETARSISEKTEILRQEMNSKAEEFAKINAVLENSFSEGLARLGESAGQLTSECRAAAAAADEAAAGFVRHAEELKLNSQAVSDTLNPLINETIATADHLRSVLNEGKNYLDESSAGMTGFSETMRKNLEEMGDSLDNRAARLEKTFLQTADNCEEIYKRLDSGISHIENSLQTHQKLAAEQSALLDKNSTYLDNKLGEYGRLISLEVEAMIERAATLDMNVKNQVGTLTAAREKISQVLDGTADSLEQKSERVIRNIEKTIAGLESELAKLNSFISKTENKNSEIQQAAEKITRKIGDISNDLALKVDDLKNRAVEAIDKFNEVSGVVQNNTAQLSETANIIASKGKEGAEALERRQADIMQAVEELSAVKSRITETGQALAAIADSSSQTFEAYKSQIAYLGDMVGEQIARLDESKLRSEKHLTDVKRRYEEFSIGNFIDESAAMIESLENMSVDVNRFFNGGEDDELWKKFYNGDHSVFARHIVKNLNRKQVVKIREEYEKNSDFRTLANRYISGFETLLNAAGQTEKPDIALAMLSGSDIGKIYYIMARVLDRLN